MIPISLKVFNFLPYRDIDPILFDGIHLACLTGNNGAGKSSLLDAITFALWGKARARRDDDLVHMGQEDMYVQLDFEQEGTTYRVVRKRRAGKRGQGQLDLFVIQEDNSLRTITEPSMRDTQIKIDEILRLDYETFVHSAFLQQGKADAFTTKTPAERKKILSDILGMSQWESYEDAAKERLKDLDRAVASMDGVLEAIREELAKEPQYKRELEAAERSYEIARSALNEAEARLELVKDAPADLRNAQGLKLEIDRRIINFRNDVKSVQMDIRKREERIESYEMMLQEAERIEAGYSSLQEAREADSELGVKLREMSDLEQAFNELKNQLKDARNQLEKEKLGYEKSLSEIERLLANDGGEELAHVEAQIIALEALEKQREALFDEIGDLREERSGLQTRQKALKTEGTEMNERIETLEHTEGALCPLCGQPLTEQHRDKLLVELNAEREIKREEYKLATNRMTEIGEVSKLKQDEIDMIGQQLAELPKLRSHVGRLAKQAEDAAAAQSRYDESLAALQAVNAILDSEDFAHEMRQQLADVEAEREAIGYDRSAHDEAQEALKQLSSYEGHYRELDFARKTLPTEQDALRGAQERQRRLSEELEKEEASLGLLLTEIERLSFDKAEFEKRSREVAASKTAEQQAYGRVREANQQLSTLEQQRKRRSEMEERRDRAREEQAVYKELQMAFGKNGVPAMIIEAAIPELEAAANELLARMTDGKMHLSFNTQRAKATGSGSIETLDIDIADELGTRPYEMYSGGEAFRVNFAIRIALSKMLARRAGAQLRTLFIDEGFGTQDEDGRNKLVEAITAIQGDFDLIVVITHIDELRDAFPVHIIVEKTPNGSRVAVR
jgi:DNA repair protein SbcC/Rad50